MSAHQALETVIDDIAQLLGEHIGLRSDPTLRSRLRRAVRDEAAEHGHHPETYLDAVRHGNLSLQGLFNRVTVQETAFFRHPEQFEVLAHEILPTLPGPVTIWSAGCANGQEPYSLAMLLEELGIEGRIIATDLSTVALQRTADAHYTQRELSGLSAERIARHLTRTGDTWQVNDNLRARVTTVRHNLLDPPPAEVLASNVVFCRNVLIYLSAEHIQQLLDRMTHTLPFASVLFLGTAETIWQVSDRYRASPVGGTFVYRRHPERGRPALAEPASPPAPPSRVRRPGERPTPRLQRGPKSPQQHTPAATPSQRDDAAELQTLTRQAQDAVARGEYPAAVVFFRKCAYLAPHDPVAHLNLGLALHAAGDTRAAQRAFDAARRAVAEAQSDAIEGTGGFDAAELIRLLDAKQRELAG